MKYLIPIVLLLASCHTITEVDHPIDTEKQKILTERESPVLTIDLYSVSIMAFVLLLLFGAIWYVGWRKTHSTNVEAVSSEDED